MATRAHELAKRILHTEWERLSALERRVLDAVTGRTAVSRNVNRLLDDSRTVGERLSDRIATFGGSWTFILLFTGVLLSWVVLNSVVLAGRHDAFDPYPYILLNLVLSMIAAVQAPIIMMSQNRASAHDRLDAQNDYAVNLKAEIEIRRLHDKLDELRELGWADLVQMQQRQIQLLEDILAGRQPPQG